MKRNKCDCGNLVEKTGTLKDGSPSWGKCCRTCRGRSRYGIVKASHCEECGFVPKVSAQLEIDHIDGNRKNNDKSNLITLCCNCHAYKSYINNDIRFIAESNPFYNKKHNEETLKKIREARKRQNQVGK
jgi:cytochrome c553